MFVNSRNKRKDLQGTPKKKKKLNQNSTFEEDEYSINTLTRKKSFVETFQFIGNIKRKDSSHIFDIHKKLGTNISDWDDLIKDDIEKQFKIKSFGFDEMDEQICDIEKVEKQLTPLKLTKKMTMIDNSINDISLRLYKHNSTIDTQEKVNETEEGKYGQNMYIQQITSIKRNSSIDKSKRDELFTSQDNQQIYERLLQDYQIKDNINCHIKHHENYICLNKLDKIFYYVKKINFSQQMTEQQILELSNMQIKLYNKDDCGNLVRFYQSWVQDISIYLIFQIVSTSLLQKTINGLKMRQNQVWALIKDCCQSIEWISKEKKNNNQNIGHLNIKPGNILKCRDKFKLSDPYIRCENLQKILSLQKDQEKMRLNFSYTAPQILLFRKLLDGLNLQKSDMYSLGICIIQNLTGLPIYLLDLKKIRNNSEKYLKGYSNALRKLIIKMISLDPNNRPYPSQILTFSDLEIVQKKKPSKRKLSL